MKRRITIEQLQELTPEQQQKLRDWWKPQEYDGFFTEGNKLWSGFMDCSNGIILTVEAEDLDIITPLEANHYDPYDYPSFDEYKLQKQVCLPLLDIGQMIELIGWKLSKIDYDGFINNYYVQVKESEAYGRPELCDALWEAVKAKL